MNTNLHRKLTSIEIAQDEAGASLAGYLRELRLQRAKHLLEITFLSVKEVASSVGINGISHFVRDFEKAYEMTPGRYAERRRKTTLAG